MEQRLTKKDNGKWEMEHGMLLNEFVSSGLDQQRAGDVNWSTTTTTTARAALTALLVADGGSQAQEGEQDAERHEAGHRARWHEQEQVRHSDGGTEEGRRPRDHKPQCCRDQDHQPDRQPAQPGAEAEGC